MTAFAAHLERRGHDVHAFALAGQGPGVLHRVRAPFAVARGARERRLGEALAAAADDAGCDATVGARHLPRVDLYWPHAGGHLAALHGLRCAQAGKLVPRGEVRVSGRHRAFLEMERGLLDGGRARRIACVSELVRRELAEAYPSAAGRLFLAPDGVDLGRFQVGERGQAGARLRAELGVAPETPLVGFSARNPELKNLPTLLAALEGLEDRPWALVAAGSSWPSIRSRRAFVVPGVDPVAFASACDLVVHPTWRDACGLVVLEALACGTPVVTTALAGAAEALTTPAAGTVLEDPGDAGALRGTIAAWLDRIGSASVDRDAVRACVADRGLGALHGALETILLDLGARSAL